MLTLSFLGHSTNPIFEDGVRIAEETKNTPFGQVRILSGKYIYSMLWMFTISDILYS